MLTLALSLLTVPSALASDPLATLQAQQDTLRAAGPEGLDRVMRAYAQAETKDDAEWAALADAVAQQRDALDSGLYWYTHLDAAKQAAADAGKPILSLRLLGELTSEYSCANSRFFRTALYADPALASWLDEHFVLHWSSERPAPLITIDYGDGRVARRTITGNSAHYVMTPEGLPIDVVPGLYGPDAFQAALDESVALWTSMADVPEVDRYGMVLAHHTTQVQTTAEQLASELSSLRGVDVPAAPIAAWLRAEHAADGSVNAVLPMRLAMSKSFVEQPILAQFMGRTVVEGGVEYADVLPTQDEWAALGDRRLARTHLSDAAVQRIADEHPGMDDVSTMVRTFRQSIARDTVLNEYLLRGRIHARMSEPYQGADFDSLNRFVYASVFETPREDAWLGMVDETVYTGLEGGGLTLPDARRVADGVGRPMAQ